MTDTSLLISVLVLVILPIIYKLLKSIKSCKSPCCTIELKEDVQEGNTEQTEQIGMIRQLINRFTPRKTVQKPTEKIEEKKDDDIVMSV